MEKWKWGGVEDCYSSFLLKNKPVGPARVVRVEPSDSQMDVDEVS